MGLKQKFNTAVCLRLKILARYAAMAPSMAAVFPWFKVGVVRARLCPGAAVGRLDLPLAKEGRQSISLDCASDTEMSIFDEVVVGRNYPLERLPFTPVLVADCGANVGYFSCMARRNYPDAEIFAWEPDDRNFRRLREQSLLQGEKTKLSKAAVSNRAGFVSLSGSGHGCEVAGEAARDDGVPCIDLGSWWRQHAAAGALLKMDIEGHETVVMPALQGNWKAPCAVFLETHAGSGLDNEIVGHLREAGFRVELLRSHSLPGDPRVFKEYFALLSAV